MRRPKSELLDRLLSPDRMTRLLAAIEVDEQAATRTEDLAPSPWRLGVSQEDPVSFEVVLDAEGDEVAVARNAQARYLVGRSPKSILRRCATDRRVIARHSDNGSGFCGGCGADGDLYWRYRIEDCPELLDLAAAYDITAYITANEPTG